jgi:hypothetical protein
MMRLPAFGRIRIVTVVGEEEGADDCQAEFFNAMNAAGGNAGIECRTPSYTTEEKPYSDKSKND